MELWLDFKTSIVSMVDLFTH